MSGTQNITDSITPQPVEKGHRYFLIGFMGCGKSYWGKQLAERLKIPFIDLDEIIEEQAGKRINNIFKQEGEEYFRQIEKEYLYMLTDSHSSFVMATGGGTPCFFNNIDYMKKNGTTIWINCSVDCLFTRLVNDKDQRPLVKELDPDQLRSYIHRKFGDRKIFYQQANIVFNEDDITLDMLADRISQS